MIGKKRRLFIRTTRSISSKIGKKTLLTKDFLVVTLETHLELTYGNIMYNDIKD